MQGADKIRSSPLHLLWHYAMGYMPDFLDKVGPPVGWVRWGHRGIYRLDNIVIPRSERKHVNSKKFEFRLNAAFEEVLSETANLDRFGKTWITKPLVEGLLQLHKMGFAHSWEAWMDGKLAGGGWGVQIGGWINMSSIFYRVSDSAKAAVGRALFHMRDRGFSFVDCGMVPKPSLNYGAEWWPRWKYEQQLWSVIHRRISLTDDRPCPPVPWQISAGIPLVRASRAIKYRLFDKPVEELPAPQSPAESLRQSGQASKTAE